MNMIIDTNVSLFYIYSHKDEKLRNKLENCLIPLQRQKLISNWHDRKISCGTEWRNAIDDRLEEANIILILVSPDLLSSDFCWGIEIQRAMRRHKQKKAVVIPVFLRSCDTENIEFMKLQGLPKNARPVTTWKNQDEAFTDISKGIRMAIDAIRKQIETDRKISRPRKIRIKVNAHAA